MGGWGGRKRGHGEADKSRSRERCLRPRTALDSKKERKRRRGQEKKDRATSLFGDGKKK